MDSTKDAIRSHMRRRRGALRSSEVAAAGSAVFELVRGFEAYREATAVLAYVATDNEMPTEALVRQALTDGKRVYLPRLEGRWMSFVEIAAPDQVRLGRFGIPEPIGTQVFSTAAVVQAMALVPLTAWDRQGGRLGRGRGFYDRAFSEHPASLSLVGLAYAFQEVPELPMTANDVRLDYVITERAVVRCGIDAGSDPLRKEGTSSHEHNLDHPGEHSWWRRIGAAD